MNRTETDALVKDLLSETGKAEAVKASGKGKDERVVAKNALTLSEQITSLTTVKKTAKDALVKALSDLSSELSKVAQETFDASKGTEVANALSAIVGAPIIWPEGFDAEEVNALLTRWKGATGRKPRGEGSGDGKQDVGFLVRITFDYPEDASVKLAPKVEHNSTWSSLSNEITRRAREIDNVETNSGYKRPEGASAQWKNAVAEMKAGKNGPFIMVVPTGKGDMKATIQAVR